MVRLCSCRTLKRPQLDWSPGTGFGGHPATTGVLIKIHAGIGGAVKGGRIEASGILRQAEYGQENEKNETHKFLEYSGDNCPIPDHKQRWSGVPFLRPAHGGDDDGLRGGCGGSRFGLDRDGDGVHGAGIDRTGHDVHARSGGVGLK